MRDLLTKTSRKNDNYRTEHITNDSGMCSLLIIGYDGGFLDRKRELVTAIILHIQKISF
jgi:hypothetical protein